jgi:hypothetical protein
MKWIVEQLISPTLRRAGTAVTGYLVGQGLPQDEIDLAVNGVIMSILIGVELIMSYKARSKRG